MNLLNRLTIKNLKLNKKRSIVTVIGILLSVALLTAVVTMYACFLTSTIEYEKVVKGNYHIIIDDVSAEDAADIARNTKVAWAQRVYNEGYAVLKDSQNEDKPYAFVRAYDAAALKSLEKKVIEGRLPQSDNEIVIPEHLKTNARIMLSVGDTITLDLGKRVSDGYELGQVSGYFGEGTETFVPEKQKTYQIVGVVPRPERMIEDYSAPGYTFITYLSEDAKPDKTDLLVMFNKAGIKNHHTVIANFVGIDAALYQKYMTDFGSMSSEECEEIERQYDEAKYTFETNDYLLQLQTNPLDIPTNQNLGGIVLIVCLIIIITSVYCIKNSFDISIAEKLKQYGMLKSVGATKKQIKKNVLFEALLLGLVGVPLGLLLGLGASYVLVLISNSLLAETMAFDLRLYFTVNGYAILAAVVLGVVTIYFSAIRSARKASKVSTIELVRNSGDVKLERKKVKISKRTQKLFGIGGVLSMKNVKRNKKKYRTTIVSLTISIAVFIALFYFTGALKVGLEEEFQASPYNYQYSVMNYERSKDKIAQTIRLDGIKEYSVERSSSFLLSDPKISAEYLEWLDGSDENVYLNILAVGKDAWENYVREQGFTVGEAAEKAFLIDRRTIPVQVNDAYVKKEIHYLDYESGDTISGIMTNRDGEEVATPDIEIAKVTWDLPFAVYDDVTAIIVSDAVFDAWNLSYETAGVYFDAENPDRLQEDCEALLGDEMSGSFNKKTDKQQMENVLLLINIFLYGFITVISLIAITNIYNTIVTSMELRKQEFAMLKSVGMTKPEFRKMINLESLFTVGKALLYGTIIGSGAAFVIFLTNRAGVKTFQYPFLAVLICLLFVLLLVASLMRYSLHKINKQNTIETIRNENI